jgi:serine/threonine protein kinase
MMATYKKYPMRESFQNPHSDRPVLDKARLILAEHEERPYFPSLMQLPRELALKHIQIIDNRGMDDAEAQRYIDEIHEQRRHATTETGISDEHIKELLADDRERESVLREIETSVFQSPSIGTGQTARVKRFNLRDEHANIPMAVKYLVTPTAKTLSAAAEHAMLWEVRRTREIEALEERANVKLVHVPHPYLHHKNEQLQCYAMELIDGFTLQQLSDGEAGDEMLDQLRITFSDIPETTILEEFEKFFAVMHTYCLHGDIKPGNIMLDRSGTFYIIDFGQSILVNDINDKEREQLDNLREMETEQASLAVRMFFKRLFSSRKQSLSV